jgi:hypothetical protein
MSDAEYDAWLEAFYDEHGYYPNEDPELLGKGLSESQAMEEHLKAKSWGEQYAQDTGHAPTHDEYRSEQPKRWYKTDNGYEMAGGFGGYTPERIASWNSGGRKNNSSSGGSSQGQGYASNYDASQQGYPQGNQQGYYQQQAVPPPPPFYQYADPRQEEQQRRLGPRQVPPPPPFYNY